MAMMSSNSPRLNLYDLPNEVLVHIFTPFPTRDLLPLTRVSHRFHAIILRLLHYRLLLTASLKEYKLMLECFHPSLRLTEPHTFCSYLGTDGLSSKHEGDGSLYEDCDAAERLGKLTSLFSRFRPEVSTEQRVPPRIRRPPIGSTISSDGTPVGEAAIDEALAVEIEGGLEESTQFVKRRIHLDGFEEFSQLCTVVNLVKVVPGSTMLLSAVTFEDGIVRIWREWLKEQANSSLDPEKDGQRILWVDGNRNVGLKLRVKEKKWNQNVPILMHRDEDPAVSYEVEIEEVHVRTTRLLLTVEQSLHEQQNYPRAVIFGAYRVAAMATMA